MRILRELYKRENLHATESLKTVVFGGVNGDVWRSGQGLLSHPGGRAPESLFVGYIYIPHWWEIKPNRRFEPSGPSPTVVFCSSRVTGTELTPPVISLVSFYLHSRTGVSSLQPRHPPTCRPFPPSSPPYKLPPTPRLRHPLCLPTCMLCDFEESKKF